MNKAFNRKGKLSFKTAYPDGYNYNYSFNLDLKKLNLNRAALLSATHIFGSSHAKPSNESVFDMHEDEVEIYKTCGGTTFWVSEQVPQTHSLDGYSELEFVQVGTLIQPT